MYGHLARDFDEQDWRDDARAFLRSCRQLAVPAVLEISRSGGSPDQSHLKRQWRIRQPDRPCSALQPPPPRRLRHNGWA